MKKFITTKLHTSSSSIEEPEKEKEINQQQKEDDSKETRRHSSIVRSKSLSSPASTTSSPIATLRVQAAATATATTTVTVMTLNSTTTVETDDAGATADGRRMVTVDDPPPALLQPMQPQQSKVQPQHAIITISKPKPPPSIFGGGGGSTSPAGQVKMCGYLKKKRNKMGGWRKMYFILQNQLLLSYSSKDDYEKRLAPFKDIINLVPGTVIIPTTGPRFTIETNSKVLYTFRCDDHKSCSEWITALLDSLKGDGGGIGDKKYSLHGGGAAPAATGSLQHHLTRRSLSSLSSSSSSASSIGSSSATTVGHYATDDPSKMVITSIRRLQHNMPPHPSAGMRQHQASLSAPNLFYGFGSITQSQQQNVKVGKLVQLPIASGTARLLERGGAAERGGQKKYKILTINEVDDDGENDEKPATTTLAATATAAVVARAISNGNLGRGDSKGIKVTTTRTSNSLGEKLNEAGRRRGGGGGDDKVKHVKSSDGGGEESNEATTALGNNFRLHTDRERMHQSAEVCRINSMFVGGSDGGSGSSKQPLVLLAPATTAAAKQRMNQKVGDGQSVESVIGIGNLAASTGDLRRFGSSLRSNRGGTTRTNGGGGGSVTDLRFVTTTTGGSQARPDLLLPAMMMDSKPLTDINHNHLAKWSAESITISLTENGFTLSSGGPGRSVGSTDTLYRSAKASSATGLTASVRIRSNSHCSDLHKTSQNYSSRTELNRTSPTRRQGANSPKNCGNAGGTAGGAPAEPIYAVVDLSLKKSRRLKQWGQASGEPDVVETEHRIKVEMVRDRETGRLQEKSSSDSPIAATSGAACSAPTSNNDYEELSELTIENFGLFRDDQDNSNDSENIYEPINIPEIPLSSRNASPSATPSQTNSLWRHLKKMNINQLMKRQPEPNQRDEPDTQPALPPTSGSVKASTFSELSKKFGHHRRSIKNRMRVLVDRQHSHPPSTGFETNNSSVSSLPKQMTESDGDGKMLRRKTSTDNSNSRGALFSTFGRNKKSRKSLSFDDFIPRKKHQQQQQQHHVGGVGLVICKTTIADNSKAHDELHRELKRQLSKRSDSSTGSAASSSGHENKNSLEL
ncbi:uncharacterized protein LOC128732427 [Sabethes cyaneus]|uniref:uncharacterized protein LOC128732427 n=1 Tax=Sabethes cyaneus TaxID=53552 RepID=UPI00237DEC14|nr:uncharacterized protein LOC128732427 [Sabethes cyaneus]